MIYEVISTNPEFVREWFPEPKPKDFELFGSYIKACCDYDKRIAKLRTYFLYHDRTKQYKVGDHVEGEAVSQPGTDVYIIPIIKCGNKSGNDICSEGGEHLLDFDEVHTIYCRKCGKRSM